VCVCVYVCVLSDVAEGKERLMVHLTYLSTSFSSSHTHTHTHTQQVERDIYQREWRYVPGFLQTFVEQEDAFIQIIEGLYPGETVLDKSSREALRYVCIHTHTHTHTQRRSATRQSGGSPNLHLHTYILIQINTHTHTHTHTATRRRIFFWSWTI
jgi:hypothetical protein